MVGISPGSDLAVPPAKTQRACLVTLLHWRRLQENTKISMLSHSLRRQQCLQVDNFDTERFIIEVQNRQNPKIGILPPRNIYLQFTRIFSNHYINYKIRSALSKRSPMKGCTHHFFFFFLFSFYGEHSWLLIWLFSWQLWWKNADAKRSHGDAAGGGASMPSQ
jgi:hypothetical protein